MSHQPTYMIATNYAHASGAQSGSSGRVCAECGAKLRRGKDMTATLCDPCNRKRTPTPDEAAAAEGGYRCEWCERAYLPNRVNQLYCSPTCRSCAYRTKDRARYLASIRTTSPTTPPR